MTEEYRLVISNCLQVRLYLRSVALSCAERKVNIKITWTTRTLHNESSVRAVLRFINLFVLAVSPLFVERIEVTFIFSARRTVNMITNNLHNLCVAGDHPTGFVLVIYSVGGRGPTEWCSGRCCCLSRGKRLVQVCLEVPQSHGYKNKYLAPSGTVVGNEAKLVVSRVLDLPSLGHHLLLLF